LLKIWSSLVYAHSIYSDKKALLFTDGLFFFPTKQRKDVIMPIKVLIKRRFKEGYVNEINKVIKELRFGAMDQEGYITAETMWDHEDPFRVVIVSNWRSIDHWSKWKNSDLRKSIEQKLIEFTDGEAEYEIFDLGVNPPLDRLKNKP